MLLAGCATTAPGPTVTRVERETHLCLDRATLQARQKAHFKRRICEYAPPKNLMRTCHDEPVETAEVLRVIDDHCVVLLAPADGHIQAGDEVEIAFAEPAQK
jgi:hypothetical protein